MAELDWCDRPGETAGFEHGADDAFPTTHRGVVNALHTHLRKYDKVLLASRSDPVITQLKQAKPY